MVMSRTMELRSFVEIFDLYKILFKTSVHYLVIHRAGWNLYVAWRLKLSPTVCPSVCLTNACINTKKKKNMYRFLYHTKEY